MSRKSSPAPQKMPITHKKKKKKVRKINPVNNITLKEVLSGQINGKITILESMNLEEKNVAAD